VEVTQLLVAAGADLDVMFKGRTALDWAKQQGHTDVVAAIEHPLEPLTKSAAQGSAADAQQ